MSRLPVLRTGVPLVIAAFVLAGCGGQSPTTTPPAASSQPPSSAVPSAAASSSVPTEPSASESPSASPSASTATEIKDPCELISASEMEKIVGADLGKASSESGKDSKSCEYALSASGRTQVYVSIGAQTDSLKKDLGEIAKKAKVTEVNLEGFDEAYSLSATRSGATVAGVAAKRGSLAYFAAVIGAKSSDTYEKYCEEIVNKVAAG